MSLALLITQDGASSRHELSSEPVLIGRARTCGIYLPVPAVSREHARITPRGDHVVLEDLGSRNGTWWRGNSISGSVPIHTGDEFDIAGVKFRVVSDTPSTLARTMIVKDDILSSSAALDWQEVYTAETGDVEGEKQHGLFQVLAEAGELITDRSSMTDLFERILDLVEKTVASERTVILLLDDDEDPVVRASRVHGHGRTSDAGGNEQIRLSQTMLLKVIRDRQSFVTHDALHDPRFQAQQSIIMQGTRSAMAAPLVDHEAVIGVLYADTRDPGAHYDRDELRTFSILANLVGVKITQAHLAETEAERQRLELELDAAKIILEESLPSSLPDVPGYEVAAYQEPCLTIGGDLYDVQPLTEERWAIIMGDVAGKGLGAAVLVSNIMAMLRLLSHEMTSIDPVRLATILNRHVFDMTDPVRFATLFFGILDPATGRIDYVNAGHNPPIVLVPDGDPRHIDATGLPVGMLDEAPYTAGSLTMAPGEVLVLYSDGIPEAELPDDTDYGQERLESLLVRERNRSAADIVRVLREDVESFLDGNPTTDDLTIVALRRAT